MLSMNVALSTNAYQVPVPTSNAQTKFQNATIVKIWLPFQLTNAAVDTSANVTEASALNWENVHVQKDLSELL